MQTHARTYRLMWKASAQSQRRHILKPALLVAMTHSISVTLLLFPPSATFKFSFVYILYSDWTCFQRALHRYTSADVPDLIRRRIWTSLNKHVKAAGKQTKEKRNREEKVSKSGGWDRVLCWFFFSFCEVSGCLLPRYLSSLVEWEGSRESGWMREAYH